jgi:hypothetical protein
VVGHWRMAERAETAARFAISVDKSHCANIGSWMRAAGTGSFRQTLGDYWPVPQSLQWLGDLSSIWIKERLEVSSSNPPQAFNALR